MTIMSSTEKSSKIINPESVQIQNSFINIYTYKCIIAMRNYYFRKWLKILSSLLYNIRFMILLTCQGFNGSIIQM